MNGISARFYEKLAFSLKGVDEAIPSANPF